MGTENGRGDILYVDEYVYMFIGFYRSCMNVDMICM